VQKFLKKVKEGNFKLKAKQYLQVSNENFHELDQSEEFEISYKKQSVEEPENAGQAEKDFATAIMTS